MGVEGEQHSARPARWRRRGVAPGVVSLGERASRETWSAPSGALASEARAALEQWSGTEVQDIVDLLREALHVDVAAVSVLDDDSFHYLVCAGLGPFANPRDQALCDLAIDVDDFFEIPDLSRDERTAHYAVVDGRRMTLRYFGSCPLVVDGRLVGRVCLFDHEPRTLDADQRRLLEVLARAVSSTVDARVGQTRVVAADARAAASQPELTRLTAILHALEEVLAVREEESAAWRLVGKAREVAGELEQGGRTADQAGRSAARGGVDLAEVMGEIESDLTVLLASTGASLSWHHLGVVRGDRAELYSILLALVSHDLAVGRGGRTPVISVRGEESPDGFLVRVRDSAAGGPEDDSRRVTEIFEAFGSAGPAAGGLAAAARIVESRGGLIGVESGAGRVGTEVWFTVPDRD